MSEAMEWLVMSWSGENPATFEQALKLWRNQSSEHERAWQYLLKMNQRISALPEQAASQSLRSADSAGSRRHLLQWLAFGFLMAGVAPFAWKSRVLQHQVADLGTGVGENDTHTLPDGSQLILNTSTAMNLDYQRQDRHLHLVSGEFLLQANGTVGSHWSDTTHVTTDDGMLQFSEGIFSVRRTRGYTEVAVKKGALLALSHAGETIELATGQAGAFSESGILAAYPSRASDMAFSWVHGHLVVEQMRLDDFLEEIRRYRLGVIRLHPDLEHYRLTGRFNLRDTDQVLNLLAEVLPVNVDFVSSYWVNIKPA